MSARAAPRNAALWGLSAAALVALGAAAAVTHLPLPGCVFKALTGLPCAACGTTRAALALLRLEPIQALRWNPLAAIALPLFVGGGLAAGALALLGREVPEPRIPRTLRVLALVVLAVNWGYLIAVGR